MIAVAGAGIAYGFSSSAEQEPRERRYVRTAQFRGISGSHIGVSVGDVDESDARRGALILDVRPDSPADTAGMRSDDLVIEFDGEPIRSARQFSRLVGETPVDRTVSAVVLRDQERVELDVTPAAGLLSPRGLERLGEDIRRHIPDLIPEFDIDIRMRPGRLGVAVMDLQPQLADYFGVDEGVLVSSVRDDSAAARAGVKAGDVIVDVDGESVSRSAELRGRLGQVEDDDSVRLGIVRNREPMTLDVTLEARSTRSRGRRI